MAEKRTVELEIKDNSKSLKAQYKEAVAELQKVSAQYGETSKQAINAAQAAAKLKDQIAFSKDLVSSFNPDAKFDAVTKSIGGALNGFQAYEGAMGLIGVKNEELQATMLKVQSAMALSQGIQGIGEAKDSFIALGAVIKSTSIYQLAYNFVQTGSISESIKLTLAKTAETEATVAQGVATVATSTATTVATTGLKLFRIALISTGIGALVVGVGLLVSNFDAIVGAVQKAVGWFSGLGDTTKNVLSIMFPFIGVIRLVVAGLEAMGVVENEQEKKQRLRDEATIKRANNRISELNKEKQLRDKLHETMKTAYDNQDKAASREIALLKAQGKDTTALERARLQATIRYQTDLQNESFAIYNQNKEKNDLIKTELYAAGVRANDFKEYNKFVGETGKIQKGLITENQTAKEARLDAINQLAIFEAEVSKRNLENNSNSNQQNIKSNKETAETNIDISQRLEDEQLRIKGEGRQKELDALDIQYKRKKEDAEKELKNDKDKVNKLAALNAQAVESRAADKKLINDKYDKIEKEAAAKASEDKIKLQDEQWYALQKLKNTQQEQELLDLQIAYDKEIEAAKGNFELEKALTEKFNKDSAAINKKYKDEQAVADKAAVDLKISNQAAEDAADLVRIQAKTDMALKIAKTFSDVYNSLNGLMNASDNERLKKVEKGSKAEEEIKKRMFKRDKKLRIVQTIIDTASNVVTSVRNGGGIPTGIPFGIAAAAMGSLQIAAISKAKFGGEDGGGGEDKPPAPAAMTAQFNTVGNNGINQLAQLQQQPTMAYVVSGQVTSQQALDRNRARNSSL